MPSKHPIYGSAGITASYHFDINGFPSQLTWPNDLNGAIAFRQRVTRAPAQDSLQDNTIALVKAHREQYIHKMVRAAYSMDVAKDNPDSGVVDLFTLGAEKMTAPQEAEAMCRALFQAIIDLPGADPLLEKRRVGGKGDQAPWQLDLYCHCKLRIERIILSMREWKGICKDILESDSAIEDFANAPFLTACNNKTFKGNNGNNGTKDSNSQKEQAIAIAALYGSELVGELKAKAKNGKLPPLSQVEK